VTDPHIENPWKQRHHANRSSTWLLKRGDRKWRMTGLPMLQDWVRNGNVLKDDEVWNPDSQRWCPAKEIPELGRVWASPSHVCRMCGYAGWPIDRSKQNGCLAVALLLLLIVPGIIYLIWSSTTPGDKVCPKCGGVNTMIPAASPSAAQLIEASPQAVTHSPPDVGFCSSCGKYHQGKTLFCPHCGQAQPT
jgi:hypothetical protein